MRLWLTQRMRRGNDALGLASPSNHSPGLGIKAESIEHMVRGRMRMFLRHTWLVTLLGTLLLGGLLWAAVYYTTKATVMTIAVGPAGSVDARIAQTMADLFRKDDDKIELDLVITAGAAQSVQMIADRKADLAILPGNLERSQAWPVVAILRQNVMALIVPAPGARAAVKGKRAKPDKSEKIDKIAQLAGRRVGVVTGGDARTELLEIVLKHYGVPIDKVQVSQIEPGNVAAAIRDNQVDVLFVVGPATGQVVSKVITAASANGVPPTFVPIDQGEGIAKRDPAFEAVDIDAGTFGGTPPTPDDTLKSLSFPEYLVARKASNRDSIAALARLVYSSRLALAAAMPGEVRIQKPDTDKDADVIVHPGADEYLSDGQKSFFDKYGDDIFYGLLIFPIFGSAIAAVAGYFRKGGRTQRLRLLQRLLDLVRRAHDAPSLEALDKLQADLDNLVVSIIHHNEQEEADQALQGSFTLALDQARFAIAARRAILLEEAATQAKKPAATAAAA